MNILIVGLGEVGTYLAKILSGEGHYVTVVDTDLHRLKRVAEVLDVQAVHGDGSRPDVLDKADAPAMDLVLAVSNDDKVNMLTCLFGKRMGARKTVLRLYDTAAYRKSKTFFRKNLLYDLLLSLDDLAAEEIVKNVSVGQAIGIENFAEGRVQMRRLKLSAESTLVGSALKDLKIPAGMLITAIDRDHEVIIPGGADVIAAGDEIFVLGEPRAIAAFEKKTGLRSAFVRRVVVYGSTGVSVKVCQTLARRNVDVRVIVEDRQEAERLSESLEGVMVLHGDATDLGLLREEHVGDADAFVAVSDRDERNLITCQLARTLQVGRTVAMVHKPDYVALYQRLGVDVSVSPRLLCANRILAFVRSRSISTIATIEEGKAEVLEIEVQPGSRLSGRRLREAGLPRGCVVGAITREDGQLVIPGGEDVIQDHDDLVLFALHEVVDQIMDLAGVVRE